MPRVESPKPVPHGCGMGNAAGHRTDLEAPMAEHFDVVVLGGGPGGYAAALYGAAAGLNIAMIEEARVGVTCLHRGCIPAKELLQTAEVLRTVRTAKEFGVEAGQPTVDLAASLARKDQVVDRLTKGLEGLLKGRKVTVVPGTGPVVDAASHHVRVSDGTELTGDALILATGSAPRSIPGFDFDGTRILSSDHVLAMDTVPGRTAIIGGGAIGCEFASYLADVGSEVTVLEAMPSILPGVDPQVAQVVARTFKKRHITVETGITITGYDATDSALTVRAQRGDESGDLEVDAIVVSVGRKARTQDIGLEGSGVEIDERGYVRVDDHLRTAVPGVYAVGDLVATPAVAHVGFAEAIVAIRTILGEDVSGIDYDRV